VDRIQPPCTLVDRIQPPCTFVDQQDTIFLSQDARLRPVLQSHSSLCGISRIQYALSGSGCKTSSSTSELEPQMRGWAPMANCGRGSRCRTQICVPQHTHRYTRGREQYYASIIIIVCTCHETAVQRTSQVPNSQDSRYLSDIRAHFLRLIALFTHTLWFPAKR
jgi:hypothetical protein